MVVSSTFESSLRRGNPTSRKAAPSSSESSKSAAAAPPRRSRSVSAFSRTSSSDFSGFSIKRDNPLFVNTTNHNNSNSTSNDEDDDDSGALFPNSGFKSDRITSKTKPKAVAADDYNNRRGRPVSRTGSDGKQWSGSGNSISKESSRSLSVVDTRRRGRSVSRTPLSRTNVATSESEVEQEGNSWMKSKNKGNLSATSGNGQKGNSAQSRSSLTRSGHRKPTDPLDASPTSLSRLETGKWNDSVSTSSFSEAELMESFQGENLVGDATAASDIYRTVKSEVRRAISDIQNELQGAIRSNATTNRVELDSDIQHEYATKLEQSQERARQLRADLAVEEHRGMELSRILKEVLPDAKTPSTKKSHPRRKTSIERRKISKCLTDDALAYFDECVSLSTFDGSDFSSIEDPPLKCVGNVDVDGVSLPHANSSIPSTNFPSSYLHDKQEGPFTYNHDVSGLTSGDGIMEQNSIDCEWNRKFQFSFSPKPGSICELQQDIKKYVKGFEKDTGKIDVDSRIKQRNSYDREEYNLLGSQQSLLFDHVFLKNRLDTGSLHLCNGGCFSASFLPFASLI
ncbi:hypothetical protein ERO13_D05G286600v2 [Gossypium hirsutum]|uniref:Uncharacterized protein n=2 Tax=Gossypium TaxID=3633 RepID=A0A1U8JDB4_GOSHI|nr:uncharacterized protein LOC107904389 [Gossypium hirsutum]KAG4148460.1 hypothetical protein ERO13_D05G286600v2 [Gossypium hirsutum]TYH73288.1 hypothetical protein ES332_D05G318400v1 [Gossypium tomentosum]